MSLDFKVCKIGNLGNIFSGGTPSTKIKEYWDGNLNWLSSGETRNTYIYTTEKFITKAGAENSSTKLANKGDIVIASAGQGFTRGQSSMVMIDTYVNQSVIVIHPNDKVNNFYLLYNLKFRYPELRQLSDHASTRGSLTTKIIKDLNINLPNLNTQNKIANIIQYFDKKIETNKKINNNLEIILKHTFFNWFIKFENYDGDYKSSELGNIPNDWNIFPLGDLVKVIDNRGKTPPLIEDNFDFPIIDVKALSGENRIVDFNKCSKYVDKETYENWFRSGHPTEYDILISTVGTIAELKLFLGLKGCLAQNVVAFNSKKEYSLYLYQYLKYIKKDLEAYNIGSVQPSIKVTHILKHPILIPDHDYLNKFNNLSSNITNLLYDNYLEIENLTKLRDTLLPKLMSGEIDVSKINCDLE